MLNLNSLLESDREAAVRYLNSGFFMRLPDSNHPAMAENQISGHNGTGNTMAAAQF